MPKGRLQPADPLHPSADRKLAKAGAGLAVNLPADWIERFGLASEDEIHLSVMEEDGKLAFKVSTSRGLTLPQLLAAAEAQGWRVVEKKESAGRLSSCVLDADIVRIRADARPAIGGRLVRNITLEGPSFSVARPEVYHRIHEEALDADLALRIEDAEGLWVRLRAARMVASDELPDPAEVDRFLKMVPGVSVRFGKAVCSLEATVKDVLSAQAAIQRLSYKVKSAGFAQEGSTTRPKRS